MYKALGAELITIYYQESPNNIVEVVQKYVDEGLVQALDWKINISNSKIHANAEFAVIDDCLHRSSHRAEYVVFCDIDEILVPRKHRKLHELLKEIDRPEKMYSQFRFCQSYWHEENVNVVLPGSCLTKKCGNFTETPDIFQRLHRTKKIKCPKLHSKSILKPMGVTWTYVHSIDLVEGYNMYEVPHF